MTLKKNPRILISIFILAALALSGCGAGQKVNPAIVAQLPLGGSVANPNVLCGTAGSINGTDYLFLAQFHTSPVTLIIHALDLSLPASPKETGSMDVTAAGGVPLGTVVDMKLAGNTLYASAGDFLLILDVSDPSSMKEISRLDTGFELGRIAVSHGLVFLATSDNILTVDASDTAAPRVAVTYDLQPDSLAGFAYSGTSLFAAAGGNLHIIDESAPLSPRETVALAPAGYNGAPAAFQQMAIEGRYAYLSAGAAGMFILDVSNPAFPVQTGGMAWNLASLISASGNLVFLIDRVLPADATDYQTWLRVIGVSNPSNPTLLASLNLNSDRASFNFAVSGDYLYWFGANATYDVVKIHAD